MIEIDIPIIEMTYNEVKEVRPELGSNKPSMYESWFQIVAGRWGCLDASGVFTAWLMRWSFDLYRSEDWKYVLWKKISQTQ